MASVSFEGGSQEFKISGTAAAVAHRLVSDLPVDRMHFNAPITRLVQTDEGVTVYAGHPNTGGPVVRAAYAVLAIPPSQAGRVKFEPEMPFERVKVQFVGEKDDSVGILAGRSYVWDITLKKTTFADN